jgi:tRNA A-37 threonylcarbamoyl transferase component Bud32
MANHPLSRILSTCWRLCTGLGIPAQRSRAESVNWRVHPKAGEYPELKGILESPEQGILSRQRGLFGSKSDFVYHQRLVIKRYNVRKPSDALLDLIRPSKATFAFRKARLLEDFGLPVAAAIAAGDAPRRGLVKHCYLIMERVQGAQTYRPFFTAGGDAAHARTLGTLIGRVHGNGLRHRDLRCENLLEDEQGKTWFIDMEGIRVQLLPRANRVLRDLRALYRNFARFQASPAPGVLAIFWRHYLREQPRGTRRQFIAARRQIFGK